MRSRQPAIIAESESSGMAWRRPAHFFVASIAPKAKALKVCAIESSSAIYVPHAAAKKAGPAKHDDKFTCLAARVHILH
jgi:hypothetical protein